MLRSNLMRLVDLALGAQDRERLESVPTRTNEYGYDPFGFHRDGLKVAGLIVRFLYRYYFRCHVSGLENVPDGRVMLVANHAGQLPFDGAMIGAALLFDGKPPRLPRAMVERFVATVPYFSYFFSRIGQVVGTPDNCLRLLEDEEVLLVFPEGARGISKPLTRRYQLQDFGTGFMRLALAASAPVVPVSIVGSEEQAPAINVKPLARLLNTPSVPLMLVPPFVPLLPLPVRYHIHFGEPRCFEGDPDDDELLAENIRQVRLALESQMRSSRILRRGVFS
ncbi:MAG: acyltransferase family protein [Myxococcales bacterium]|nr:acyltransferase family protein [Myxococcales bacterium]